MQFNWAIIIGWQKYPLDILIYQSSKIY